MQKQLQKSTRNVRRWQIPLILLLTTSIVGCASWFKKPIETVSVPIERTPLALSMPTPIVTTPIEWIVITKENADDVFSKMTSNGDRVVLFAMTAAGYERLSVTMAEVRNFIATQRLIILKYKEYYEPNADK